MPNPPGDPDRVAARVRDHWNDRAPSFDDAPEHGLHSEAQRRRWLAVLREWVGDRPRRTLDVGCGTGVISLLLAALGHDVLGVDAAPAMVAQASEKARDSEGNVSVAVGDATRLGVPDDAVDVVVERHLLWTLPDPAAALAEWQRVVEPGGRIVVFEGRWDHGEDRGEYATLKSSLPLYDGRSTEGLAALLEEAGLVDVDAEPLEDPVLRGQPSGTDLPHDYAVAAGTVPE
jgi:ubiquinone/menaquinone biosynthesis C-methylase UbiE